MIQVSADIERLVGVFGDVVREQVPHALALALTDTATEAREAVKRHIDGVFDLAVPFTRNAFQVKPASKKTLVAVLEQKEDNRRRHYLPIEETGGGRPQTGFERLLGAKVFGANYVLPGDNARRDKYGNWSAGQRGQVLSALGAQRDPTANITKASAKRNKGKRLKYFTPLHGLTPGIYSRDAAGNLGVVAIFTDSVPTYSPRLAFYETVAADVLLKFGPNFERRFAETTQTARA